MRLFSARVCRYLLVAVLGASVAAMPARAESRAAADSERASRKIFARWIDAMGGGPQLQSLTSIVYQCKIGFVENIPPIDLSIRSTAGGLYRCEYVVPGAGELIQAFDGSVAWQQNLSLGFGLQTSGEHEANRLMADFRAALRVESQFPRRVMLPDEIISGRRLRVLEMQSAEGRIEKWYFDPQTGQRVRVEVLGQNEIIAVDFEDFRPVPGTTVVEPFRIVRHEGERKVEITVQSVLCNESMEAGLFAVSPGRLKDQREIDRILFYNAQAMGLSAITQIRSRISEQTVKVTTSGMTFTSKTYNKRPNLMMVEQDVPGMGPTWRGYDGKVGWAWSEVQGYREMQGAELRQILGETDLAGPMKLAAQCPLRRLLGNEVVDGRALTGIALATPLGTAGNFYFDQKTYELARVETEVQAGPSGKLKVVAEFSDYRPVDGVLLPFHTIFTNPAMRMEITVLSVKQNVEIDDAQFLPRTE